MKSPRPRGQPPKKAKDRKSVKAVANLTPADGIALEKYLKQNPLESTRSILMERVHGGPVQVCCGCDKKLSLPYVGMKDGTSWHLDCRQKFNDSNIKYLVDKE